MKILSVHSNYFVHKEKNNHVNSIQNMSKPYAADTVSFGAKQYTLGENKYIGNVSTRLYIGKKNSIADYVEAKAVVLEEGARIKHLKLNEAILLHPPEFSEDLKNI